MKRARLKQKQYDIILKYEGLIFPHFTSLPILKMGPKYLDVSVSVENDPRSRTVIKIQTMINDQSIHFDKKKKKDQSIHE